MTHKSLIVKNQIATIIATFFLLSPVQLALAQETTTPAKDNQNWSCLTSANPGNSRTVVQVSGSCSPANVDSYIVTCGDSKDGKLCTTGNNNYDDLLNFGKDNATKIHPHFSVAVTGGSKIHPIDGYIDTNVTTATRDVTTMAFSFYCVTLEKTRISDDRGNSNSLEYGTFEFNPDASCTTTRLDPYGTVFDSQSLEPLPNISLTLLDQNKSKLQLPGVPNPVTTISDGAFNFLVEAGTYYLSPIAPGGYAFESQPFIHPNYAKAYANIYKPDESIVENAGIPEHRDIALNPGVNTPYHAQPVNIAYGLTRFGASTKISGKQSHPLTIVSFQQNGNELKSTNADRYGFYEVIINTRDIMPDSLIDIYLTKVDLTANEQTATPKKSISIEAQPPYIEGKATDRKGTAIPNAQVKVKLTMSDKVYYQTEADARGVFVVPPQNVPVIPYYLEMTPPNSLTPVKITTTEFAKVNKDYLATNNINLMSATKNGRPLIVEKKITPPQNTVNTTDQNPPVDVNTTATSNNTLVMGLVVVFMIFVVGAGLYIFMKQKNGVSIETPEPPIPPVE